MPGLPGRRAAAALLLVLAGLSISAPLAAAAAQEVAASVDAGGANVRYAGGASVSAASLSPSLRARWPLVSIDGAGTLAQLAAGGWSSQGTTSVSFSTPAAGPFTGQLAADAGGSAHWDGTRTGQMLLAARAHVDGVRGGAWAGAGTGRTWDGALWRAMLLGELGGWARAGEFVLSATATPTVVDQDIRYMDSALAAHWAGTRVAVDVYGGARAGARLPLPGSSATAWGGVSVLATVMSPVAVVAGAGSYPVDLVQGFPGGRYVSLALRLTWRDAAAAATSRAESGVAARRIAASIAPSAAVDSLRVDAGRDSTRTLRLHAPAAALVEIMGDFTGWKPVALAAGQGGWWSLPLAAAPGQYQLNVRVNGGPWLVPVGALPMRDEFGGVVGVLEVK